jgi:hypothetical protein
MDARKPCRGQAQPAVHVQHGNSKPDAFERSLETGGDEALAGTIDPREAYQRAPA